MIKVHNDGKGKYQSFEAYITGDIDIRGYGETEEEAITELKYKLDELIHTISNTDFNLIQYVDCKGDEIK
jgi:SHS2 domain-containing protein